MKKNLIGISVIICTLGVMTFSCGGNKSQDTKEAENTDVVELTAENQTEPVEETVTTVKEKQNGYKPPFSFTACQLKEDANKLGTFSPVDLNKERASGDYEEITIEIQLLSNGTYQGNSIDKMIYQHGVTNEYPSTFNGKWTTTSRTIGEDRQKVYVIHRSSGTEWYIAEDGEYLYTNWQSCDDMKTLGNNVYKITEIKQD